MLWQFPAVRDAVFKYKEDPEEALKSGDLSAVQLLAVQRLVQRA